MEYELKDAGPSRKELLLKFSAEDVNQAFDKSYADINGYVRIKGFRQGKAPRRTLEKRYAKEATEGVRENLFNDTMRKVIEEEKIKIFGPAVLKNIEDMPASGSEFTLDVEFDVVPEFELPEYKGIKLSEREVNIEDAKVDDAIDRYRRMFANYQEIEEPAQKDDIIDVNFVANADGQEIMSMTDQRLRVDGEILFGLPCADLVEKFTGAKKGEVVNLVITLPEDHPNADLRGKPADITVTVLKVNRGDVPELTDAFAEGLGMGSIAQFRERIKNNLIRDAYVAVRQEEEREIIEKILEKVTIELPEASVKAETDAILAQQRDHMLRSGAQAGPALDEQVEKFRPEAEKDAQRKLRWTFVGNRIAEKEEITVTNEDMAAQIEALAQNYRTTPAKIIQRIREMDGVESMMSEILSIKVMHFITQHAEGVTKYENPEAVEMNEAAAAIGKAHDHDHGECECGHDHGHDHGHHHHHHGGEGDDCCCGQH